jgi:nitrite reductase (NO-forming)
MQRSRLVVTLLGAVACALAGVTAAVFGLGSASAGTTTAKPVTVIVKATEFKFVLSKKTVPVGTVIFKVENKGKIGHDFKINGKKTPIIAAGKTATLKVVFKKKGSFAYLCTIPGHAANGMKGKLAVGVAAPPPATTTVAATTTAPATGPGGTINVTEFEYGFTLSPTAVPSGNVTFVMTNTGSVTHNFDIQGVKAGPFLNPGETASMTVNLQAGKKYTYQCDVEGHAAAGMVGTFVPTP